MSGIHFVIEDLGAIEDRFSLAVGRVSPKQEPVSYSVVLILISFHMKNSARIVSVERLGTRRIEGDGYDNCLPTYCYGQVRMRVIDKRSCYTVV
jgi:hypothetical protein